MAEKTIVIVGKKIIGLRRMTKTEMAREGWDHRPGMVILLEGGIKLYASRDDEGNGPGALFGSDKDGEFHLG